MVARLRKQSDVRRSARKISLSNILLVCLLCVVLLLGLLPFSALLASGTKQSLENNAADIVDRVVENKQAVLQNAMCDQWSHVREETDYLNAQLLDYLSATGTSIADFSTNSEMKQAFVQTVFPELADYVRRDTSSGVFLVLGNGSDTAHEQSCEGFFLRDSDPTNKTETDSDLLLERGDKTLSQTYSISLDNAWAPLFTFGASGQRACDSFFYKPFEAALAYGSVDPSVLGYWSEPFVLEDASIDNHHMITYSIPLVCNGVVYGVVGTEVSTSYLENAYFNVDELQTDGNAGYALAIKHKDGTYEAVAGKGTLYSAISSTSTFLLDSAGLSSLYFVRDVVAGNQRVMACEAPLSLYASKVPYDNTDWVLLGFVPESNVFGMGESLYNNIAAVIVVCALLGMVFVAIASRRIALPVQRLVQSVRSGIAGLRTFKPTRIRELDDLHHVMLHLAEDQMKVEERLSEEKERYRLAVESSSDVFFTYRVGPGTVEVVNSARYSGSWDATRFTDTVILACLDPDGQKAFLGLVSGKVDALSVEVKFTDADSPAGRWLELCGRAVADDRTGTRVVIGYLRNIDEQKRRELARAEQADRDSVTGFYRKERGLERIRESRRTHPEGMLVLCDLERFNDIVRRFGLTFGDVVLEEFAVMVRQVPGAREADVLVRAGSDEVLIWVPDGSVSAVHYRIEDLAAHFSTLVRHGSVRLGFNAGVVAVDASLETDEAVRRAKVCVAEAREGDRMVMDFSSVLVPDRPTRPFGKIESTGYVSRLSLSSLALNLLDRRFSVAAALDLLVGRLRERFTLENLVITSFDQDYLAASIRYCWRALEGVEENTCVVHVSPELCERLEQCAGDLSMRPMSAVAELLPDEVSEQARHGITFTMSENGHYSGSIFMIGIPEDVFANEGDTNVLREICSIIQSRLAQEHLDQSAQAKSDFLARMSHEIRTPMNGIIGMTDIALEQGQSPERMRECLEKVSVSSHYLLGLLNDILDMSKIESGKMELVEAPFDLRKTIEALHPVLDGRFEGAQQRFIVDAQVTHTYVVGDELRLSQVLINLLGNANKYSPADTDVVLRVREVDNANGYVRLSFAVIDHGIGVDEADRKRIFGRFEQVDTVPSRRQGTGLGLAICNHLVRMMGSSIDLQSEVGVGSTFSFSLTMPIASQVRKAQNQGTLRSDYSGMHALVAEDNELNQEILSYLLKELGFSVTCVGNGVEAVQAFEQSAPGTFDVIVMDVMMPVMGGLEATHHIRGLARTDARTVPIIAASANAFDEDVNRSIAAGMNAHMSKPVDAQVLKETLAKVIS